MLTYVQYYDVQSYGVEQLLEQFGPTKCTFVDAASIHMLLVRINITNQLLASGVNWMQIIDRSKIYRILAHVNDYQQEDEMDLGEDEDEADGRQFSYIEQDLAC